MYLYMYACIQAYLHVCKYACMHVCMQVYMCVTMYVCDAHMPLTANPTTQVAEPGGSLLIPDNLVYIASSMPSRAIE